MKKIKIISMILIFVILVTSCNLGMMFTSNAEEASTIDGIRSAVDTVADGGTITLTENIDASDLGSVEPIDFKNKKINFDGGNKLISNLTLSGNGLFTNVGEGSSFTNLGMYDCYITDFTTDSKEGYGFLAGSMSSATVTNCFVDGTIAVYGNDSNIGGLAGSFSGTMTNSYAMVDIHTDGSYVGGLIGKIAAASSSVSLCYSTGSIDNDGRDHIGGLIGYSADPCVTNSYTTTCILNPYADTVKSIGVIEGLDATHNVYYDENLSLQKQGDRDPHRCSPSELRTNLNGNGWTSVDGYYPQLTAFYSSSTESFKRISAISAVVVDIDRGDGITTGREFTVVSTTSRYSFATLTNKNIGTDSNQLNWRISGGIDEYYFDPTNATEANFPTNKGSAVNGLSGNTFDVNTGKYLFVNTGDVKFTAYSGSFERDIYVHVTTADKNPYIQGGTGKEGDPFLINDVTEFDMIRVYCLDDETGHYYYKIIPKEVNIVPNINTKELALDFNDIASWVPILGMKGHLDGNNAVIRALNITSANEGCAGLFATVTENATITNIHISNAIISVLGCDSAGILAGTVENSNLDRIMVSGRISGVVNAGMIAGSASGTTTLNIAHTMGLLESTATGGGLFGITEATVSSIDCYSTAVMMGAQQTAGLYAQGDGSITNCLFTGMLSPGANGMKYGLTGGNGEIINSYFDWQAAGIHNSKSSSAKMTGELSTSGNIDLGENWTHINAGKFFPQLVFFSTAVNKCTRRHTSSAVAAAAVTYVDSITSGSTNCFTTASVTATNSNLYINDGSSKLATISAVTSNGGYTRKNFVFTKNTGGLEIYGFNISITNYLSNTRYILFNVKTVNVHYKFTFENTDEQGNVIDSKSYNSYMTNRGLTEIKTEFGSIFNAIMDSSVTDYNKFCSVSPSGDKIYFDMSHASKFGYRIEAYADKEQSVKLTVGEGNSVTTVGMNDVYINFIINTNQLPWGIYHIACD